MYKNVSAKEMLSTIDNGWYPVWFAVEDCTLMVDLCVNYRLTDGKVLFLRFYSTDPKELSLVSFEVAKKAKENWLDTLDKMTSKIYGQIEEASQTEKNIASIEWKENQKYLLTYSNNSQEIYQCTCSSDKDIYVLKVLTENENPFGNSEKNVRKVVFSDTKIELVN